MSRALDRCYNIARLRERASKRLPAPMFHYIDGAAGDEWTMRQNTDAFDRYELVPRFLVDVSEIDLSTTVFGQKIECPFSVRRLRCRGFSIMRGRPLWLGQRTGRGPCIRFRRSRRPVSRRPPRRLTAPSFFRSTFSRTGPQSRVYSALQGLWVRCVGSDRRCPVAGNRERDLVTGMTIPPKLTLASLFSFATHPGWVWNYFTNPPIELAKSEIGSRVMSQRW
ncbi:MAG: hypothetical protein CM1200mP36_00110 [Gammaproteobacteria bacterium]|nr:MAG: hypothetical protein CM1200mP36_00110 [Gammaproteobacteria bacterium]